MTAWNSLSFTYNEILPSAKMNLLQDNFTALAQGLVGAPAILKNAIQTGISGVNLHDDNSFTSTSYADRGGASVSLNTNSGNIIVSIRSGWRTLSQQNVYFRINRNSGAETRSFGSGFSVSSQTFMMSGSALFTGLAVGTHIFGFDVRVDGGTAQNWAGTLGEWMPFEMFAVEV